MKKSLSSMTPSRFRALLISTMVLILLLATVGFYFIQTNLARYAEEINDTVTAATSSENSVGQLKQLKSELDRLSDVNQRAASIVADSQSFQYQNQIIDDLNGYARQSGISISQFDFQPAAAATTPDASGSGATPTGLKSILTSITLSPPIPYTNLLRFLNSIEQNLTKMQISGVAMTNGQDAGTVTTEALTIEVYTR